MKKILNEQQLRKHIAIEVKKMLREDKASDVISKAASLGPGAVRSMADSEKDKEGLKKALHGSYDGEGEDDKVSVSAATPVSVGGLKATQSQIDLMKSVAFPLGGFAALEKMVVSKTSGAPGSITISGDLVIDGHHRWSGVVGISGPEGTVSAQNVDLPGESDKSKLAAAQLAIAAYKDTGTKMPAASDPIEYNILGLSADAIKKMILDNVGNQTDPKAPGPVLNDDMVEECSKSKTIAKWAGFKIGADADQVRDAIATKVGENLSTLQKGDAPPRADMPQFDDKSIGGNKAKEDIYSGLQAGEFNVSPPFGPQSSNKSKDDEDKKVQKSGFNRTGDVVLERWQKLAGLIK